MKREPVSLDALRGVDLRRVRHFVVLAETLNFSRAAERLHMAQPPLSVSIRKLETELGVPLFVRDSRGVSLTAAGRAALGVARRLLFHAGQFAQAAQASAEGTGGSLRIGFVGSTTHGVLQRLVGRFRAEHPGVTLVLRESTSLRIVQQLDQDDLDVGLVRLPLMQGAASVALAQLEEDELIAALPRGHVLAEHDVLQLALLAQENFVMYAATESIGLRSAAMSACQQAGFLPRITQEAVQVQTVLSLVETGLGVALVPAVMQRYGRDHIVYRRLQDPPPAAKTSLALAWHVSSDCQAAHRFRDLALGASAGAGRLTPADGPR